ncbi:MAG: hypothetical protein ACJARR_002748 [Pseudophaeobacter arcticus]|jgi:hypothetical protein
MTATKAIAEVAAPDSAPRNQTNQMSQTLS